MLLKIFIFLSKYESLGVRLQNVFEVNVIAPFKGDLPLFIGVSFSWLFLVVIINYWCNENTTLNVLWQEYRQWKQGDTTLVLCNRIQKIMSGHVIFTSGSTTRSSALTQCPVKTSHISSPHCPNSSFSCDGGVRGQSRLYKGWSLITISSMSSHRCLDHGYHTPTLDITESPVPWMQMPFYMNYFFRY